MKTDLLTMLKTLHFTLQNGKTLSSGMQLLATNTQSKKERKVYEKIYSDMKEGCTFSQALKKSHVGSSDVLEFISMAEKGVDFRNSLLRVINFLEIKDEFQRESNEKTTIPFVYLFMSALVVVGVSFFAIPYQIGEAKGYSKEIVFLVQNHLHVAQIMGGTLFVFLLFTIFYFLVLLIALFNHSFFIQKFAKNISLYLPLSSKIVEKFEKFSLFKMMGEMLKSGISLKKTLLCGAEATTITKFKDSLLDTLDEIKYDGKLTFSEELYSDIERALLVGVGSSAQIGTVMVDISHRAKAEALMLTGKFLRVITLISIFLMAFAVFLEFYTVVLTQMIIQKGLIDMTKGGNLF